MSKQVYTAKDISEILGVSESKSYQYIRQMNKELEEKGLLGSCANSRTGTIAERGAESEC